MTREPTVSILKETYQTLSKKAQKNHMLIKTYVNELLLMNLEKDDFLSKYAPYISKIGIEGNTLYLKDHKKDKVIEIRLRDGKIQSSNTDPIYVQYAMALPELGRLK